MGETAPEITAHKSKDEKAEPPNSLLHRLVAFEGEVLKAKNRSALKHLTVNKARLLLPLGHAFLYTRQGANFKARAVSNQAMINQQAPFMQWLGLILKSRAKAKHGKAADYTALHDFMLKSRRADDDFDYPYPHAYWVPLGTNIHEAGLLFTRETKWEEAELPILERIGQIVGLSWTALEKPKTKRRNSRKKIILLTSAALAFLALFIPVPITTLAPAEIIAADPFIVTAPIDGVIDTLRVKPGTLVKKGDVLATLNDTAYRNEYRLAAEEKAVAAARHRQASLTAFVDAGTKRELAIAEAELKLAKARETYAAQRLSKTKLIADRDGLVIYTDEKDWAGRPVVIGEKIMQIADPARVQLRIESPIADSDALRSGARVRMFLDAAPLAPMEATLTRANYYAQPQAGGQLAYEAYAGLADGEDIPRIGGRGVAKIYGGSAPLGYWLFRKPIASLRQKFGF